MIPLARAEDTAMLSDDTEIEYVDDPVGRRVARKAGGRHGEVLGIEDNLVLWMSPKFPRNRSENMIHNLEDAPAITRENIDAIVRFLPTFEAEGCEFGKVAGFYCDFSPEVDEFQHALYEHNWIVGFDWSHWVRAEGAPYVRSVDAINEADIDVLRKLLTAFVRQERFCAGSLLGAFESGYITAILQRLKQVGEEMAR
jgi:hypothetical protein